MSSSQHLVHATMDRVGLGTYLYCFLSVATVVVYGNDEVCYWHLFLVSFTCANWDLVVITKTQPTLDSALTHRCGKHYSPVSGPHILGGKNQFSILQGRRNLSLRSKMYQ